MNGNDFDDTAVGGYDREGYHTISQMPPAAGDEWFLRVALRAGQYSINVRGWCNPWHGVLDLYLDGIRITADGLDWYGARTEKYAHRLRRVRVAFTGEHTLRGCVARSNANASPRSQYWMCLKTIAFDAEEQP